VDKKRAGDEKHLVAGVVFEIRSGFLGFLRRISQTRGDVATALCAFPMWRPLSIKQTLHRSVAAIWRQLLGG